MKKAIKEFHKGDCGGHHYWNTTAHKILRTGFYWWSIFVDVYKEVFSYHEFHIFDGSNVRKVSLVILQDVRNVGEIEFQGFEIVLKVLEAFYVFGHFIVVRIGDENNPIDPAQDELAGGVVNDLARNGVKLKFCFETFDRHGFNRQEIEKQSAVRTCGQRNELPLLLDVLNIRVDLFEVGCLAAFTRAVIDNFDLQLFGGLINDGHKY